MRCHTQNSQNKFSGLQNDSDDHLSFVNRGSLVCGTTKMAGYPVQYIPGGHLPTRMWTSDLPKKVHICVRDFASFESRNLCRATNHVFQQIEMKFNFNGGLCVSIVSAQKVNIVAYIRHYTLLMDDICNILLEDFIIKTISRPAICTTLSRT